MKKILGLILSITMLFFAVTPASFAKSEINIQQEDPNVVISVGNTKANTKQRSKKDNQKSKSSSSGDNIFKKILHRICENLIFYGLFTLGTIKLLDKVGFLNEEDVYKSMKNTDFKQILSNFMANVKSVPRCVSALTTGNNTIIDKKDKTTTEHVTSAVNHLKGDGSAKNRVLNATKELEETKIPKFYGYTLTHGTALGIGAAVGTGVGAIGKVTGLNPVGCSLYGAAMIPYLSRFRKNDTSPSKIIENSINLYENTKDGLKTCTNRFKDVITSPFKGFDKASVPAVNETATAAANNGTVLASENNGTVFVANEDYKGERKENNPEEKKISDDSAQSEKTTD